MKIDLTKLKAETEKVLPTLPLAYYLKVSTIDVALDETSPTSYFDPSKFNIHIALNNIFEAVKDAEELSDVEFEKVIRGFLYHELSHALLTPRTLMRVADAYAKTTDTDKPYLLNPNLANIIEDERIETLLKHYYHNVDFKENLRKVVKLEHAKNFQHFVFNAVRFRYSPADKELVNKAVEKLISCTSHIDAYRHDDAWDLASYMNDLLITLKSVWDKLPKEEKASSTDVDEDKHGKTDKKDSESTADTEGEIEDAEDAEDAEGKEENASGENEDAEGKEKHGKKPSKSKDGEESSKDSSPSTESSTDENENSEETEGLEEDFEPTEESLELDKELIEKLVDEAISGMKHTAACSHSYDMKISDFVCDKNTKQEMLKIIGRNVGFGTAPKSVMYGYSGKFNTKRFATDFNDSCKWFAKKSYENTGINAHKCEKKILNIWLDQSGSFGGNDYSVNKVLKALYEIEKERTDFEWHLIRLTCDCKLENNADHRYSQSWSGNALPQKKIAETYNKVNNSQRELNIVLFDGDANSLDFCGSERARTGEVYGFDALKPFDNQRTIFITERSNTYGIHRKCPNARAIIEENCDYANQLAANVVKALDLLF